MSYIAKHKMVDHGLEVSMDLRDGRAVFRCFFNGTFQVHYPGALRVRSTASFFLSFRRDGFGRPFQTVAREIPLTVEIRTPDGKLFTPRQVSLNDLARFRDPGGTAQGEWSYIVRGQSEPIAVREGEIRVRRGGGSFGLTLEEVVGSQSAPPLVDARLGARAGRSFRFDLFRVGDFVARARSTLAFPNSRRMRLLDPDGQIVAVGEGGRLRFPVTLRTLARSRTASGSPRLWTLEVSPSTGPVAAPSDISATVVATTRLAVDTLHRRIEALLGPNGENVDIFGDHRPQSLEMLARLRIKDEVTAGTVDLLHLIDDVVEGQTQDPDVDVSDIRPNVPYVVASKSRNIAGPIDASLAGLRITTIRIRIGQSEHLEPPMPALKVEVGVVGQVNVKLGGLTLATAKVRDGRVLCEAGLRLDADGEVVGSSWIEPDRLDLDIHWTTLIAAGIISFGILGIVGLAVVEAIEEYFQDDIPDGFDKFMQDVLRKAREPIDAFLGGHFTLRAIRLDGDDLLIDYLAPLEPDPRPSEGYQGIIGRSFEQLGPDAFRFRPPTLGNTWANANLGKIDHIVVVMMENRSYDHVLGHRSLAGLDQSDGLTREMIDFLARQSFTPPQPGEDMFELDQERLDRLQGQAFTIRRFEESAIPRNELGLKTKFPRKPPIFRRFVEQQLSKRLQLQPSGRTVNSPNGFLGAFIGRIGPEDMIKVQDVLGYYEAADLGFYSFLADNYAFCDRYHCSHPGPTQPNRMFALTGDVQRDRAGQPILDNSAGDTLRLSRAMTIFDLLTRLGIGWRVYESFPSVTMLRFFARYATDDVNIADLARFHEDAAGGRLPAVTFVEPAMHHHPPNDDHPVADMYNGQVFLKEIYQSLRASQGRWARTLLIITYDEHGGFYDHVVPPMAEVRRRPTVLAPEGRAGAATPPREVLDQLVALAGVGGGGGTGLPPPSTFTPYGVRVPTFVVSPWVAPGKGPSIVLDHCSILKTILARFCPDRPFMSDRVNASRSFESYLSEPAPRLAIPDPPALPPLDMQLPRAARRIDTLPLSRRLLRSGDLDSHDLLGGIGRLMGRPQS